MAMFDLQDLRARLRAGLVACLFLGPISAAAQTAAPSAPVDVDLQLVLAVDVSASIDILEASLQRRGYINALIDPGVIQAIGNGRHGRIAVAYTEWAGPLTQRVLVDWQIIDGLESARAFTELLEKAPIEGGQRTSISNAILHAVHLLRKSGLRSDRRVIDISGDGPNNGGFHVHETRYNAIDEGITINGLPILNGRPSPLGIAAIENIDLYYEDCVIGGSGAFIVVADTLNSFAAAVRRKMILEIAGLQPRPLRRRLAQPQAGIIQVQSPFALTDCTIGERQFEIWRKQQNLKN